MGGQRKSTTALFPDVELNGDASTNIIVSTSPLAKGRLLQVPQFLVRKPRSNVPSLKVNYWQRRSSNQLRALAFFEKDRQILRDTDDTSTGAVDHLKAVLGGARLLRERSDNVRVHCVVGDRFDDTRCTGVEVWHGDARDLCFGAAILPRWRQRSRALPRRVFRCHARFVLLPTGRGFRLCRRERLCWGHLQHFFAPVFHFMFENSNGWHVGDGRAT